MTPVVVPLLRFVVISRARSGGVDEWRLDHFSSFPFLFSRSQTYLLTRPYIPLIISI